MNIEIHTPHGQVNEWLIDYVKSKLMEFRHRNYEIGRAQVYFREQKDTDGDNKVCEMDLTTYGDSIFVHRIAASYEEAAREVLNEVADRVEQQVKSQKEPPDQIVSTVKV